MGYLRFVPPKVHRQAKGRNVPETSLSKEQGKNSATSCFTCVSSVEGKGYSSVVTNVTFSLTRESIGCWVLFHPSKYSSVLETIILAGVQVQGFLGQGWSITHLWPKAQWLYPFTDSSNYMFWRLYSKSSAERTG